ncbi:MAG: translesion error-prone DNA polymerase V autoproteolytic subunit [Chlamydiota bacterium]
MRYSQEIEGIFSCDNLSHVKLPLFHANVQAGFPSPAEDYLDQQLDLNQLLISHPAATFFVRVAGDSMVNAGITSGDILVVDRALPATTGKIAVVILNSEFTVKRLCLKDKKILLLPENPSYPVIEVEEGSDFQVWGIVTYVIHKT